MSNIERVDNTEAKANFDILEINLSLDEIADLLKGKVVKGICENIAVVIKNVR